MPYSDLEVEEAGNCYTGDPSPVAFYQWLPGHIRDRRKPAGPVVRVHSRRPLWRLLAKHGGRVAVGIVAKPGEGTRREVEQQ
jgi:hypothetical protein